MYLRRFFFVIFLIWRRGQDVAFCLRKILTQHRRLGKQRINSHFLSSPRFDEPTVLVLSHRNQKIEAKASFFNLAEGTGFEPARR